MDQTVIISTWLPSIQWLDGWKAMQDATDIRQPSLWMIDPQPFLDRFSKRHEQLLSGDEIARAMRFHQMDHILRFKAAHTALRLLLGYATHLDPATLRFEKGYRNKPRLATTEHPDIEFNLSYTENQALIGLNRDWPIGTDIEWLRRPLAIEDMLGACFSDNEIAFIQAGDENMLHRFFTLWTRKEAILKLTGEGIGDHLPHFEVLDGVYRAKKRVIGVQPPEHVYLYSFLIEAEFIGCFASPTPVTQCFFYRL